MRMPKIAKTGLKAKGIVGRVVSVVLLLAVCVIPVLFVASPITYIPLAAVLLCIVFSWIYLQVLKRSLQYSEASMLASCERGAGVEFSVVFSNTSVVPFVKLEPCFYITDLFGGMDVEMSSSMILMPKETFDFRFQASFDHIGTYSAGVSRIVIGDIFGLFQHTVVNKRRHEVQVLPKIFELSKLDLSNVSMQESRRAYQTIVTDDMDYAGVREYEPGDPIKTIHWKLSARNTDGQYLTRLFESNGNPSIDIILDHTSPLYDSESLMQVFDGVVESALSVGKCAYEAGLDTRLIYTSKYGETVYGGVQDPSTQASMSLINDIPRLVVDEGHEALRLLNRTVRSNHSAGNIAFCTAHVSEEAVSLLAEAKTRDRNPLLFLIVPKTLEGREREEYLRPLKRLNESQVVYYIITDAEQIRG